MNTTNKTRTTEYAATVADLAIETAEAHANAIATHIRNRDAREAMASTIKLIQFLDRAKPELRQTIRNIECQAQEH